jgi:hypothetical protein
VEDDSHVAFGQKFPGEKESVRWCVVMKQQSAPLSPKFMVKSLHIFTQSPQKITVECRINCLACQDEFFVNIPLDVKENEQHALEFALQLSRLFQSW